jgi:hypothetical protein
VSKSKSQTPKRSRLCDPKSSLPLARKLSRDELGVASERKSPLDSMDALSLYTRVKNLDRLYLTADKADQIENACRRAMA